MKKFIYYLSAAAMVLSLVGCAQNENSSATDSSLPPTTSEPEPIIPTYVVKTDASFNHVQLGGLKESYEGGSRVELTVSLLDGFIFKSEKIRAFEDTEDNKEIDVIWGNSNETLSFMMPYCNVNLIAAVRDPDYDIVFDKYTHLNGGDITMEGTTFHFDEKSINENPEDGFIELGPYGFIDLENYVPGLSTIHAEMIYDGGLDEGFLIGTSSTPNSFEEYNFTMTGTTIIVTPDRPYFTIRNQYEKPVIIKCVKLNYTGIDTEKPVKDLIVVEDQTLPFDPANPIKPYEINPIDESLIPENRIVRKIEPTTYTEPGEYVYGYEVYSKTNEGELGKLLYSSTANFYVEGTSDNKHLAIFHLEDKVATIPVEDGEKVDLSLSEDIKTYNWNNEINDFDRVFTSDRHFYPVYSVVGVPSEKDGDGCYPINTTYSGLEGTIRMPDPITKEGYVFGGWFMDVTCETPFDPEGHYEGNITLYAKCFEQTQTFRKVYYYDYNGAFLPRIDYLRESEDTEMTLPTFEELHTAFTPGSDMEMAFLELRLGANRVKMLRPKGLYPIEKDALGEYPGDKLTYQDIKDFAGDIKLIVSTGRVYETSVSFVSRVFKDLEEHQVVSGFLMHEAYQAGDRVLFGRYVDWDKPSWTFTYNTFYDPERCDTFTVTDAVDGYIIDQGSYNSIATYGYANKNTLHKKPLHGILRHDSVIKVNRRAFFNRYGLTGTYFPRNAREFDIESYSNTHFNGTLLLPKGLNKIGARAFVGSTNIHTVFLPKTIDEISFGAFCLGDYDESNYVFKNIRYRTAVNDKITFYYEGSEKEFSKLDKTTKQEILSNAAKIFFNVDYNPYYGR